MSNLVQIFLHIACITQIAFIGLDVINSKDYIIIINSFCIGIIFIQHILMYKNVCINVITITTLMAYIIALYTSIIKSSHYIMITILTNYIMSIINLIVIISIPKDDSINSVNNTTNNRANNRQNILPRANQINPNNYNKYMPNNQQNSQQNNDSVVNIITDNVPLLDT